VPENVIELERVDETSAARSRLQSFDEAYEFSEGLDREASPPKLAPEGDEDEKGGFLGYRLAPDVFEYGLEELQRQVRKLEGRTGLFRKWREMRSRQRVELRRRRTVLFTVLFSSILTVLHAA
jgi:hypothetical protein